MLSSQTRAALELPTRARMILLALDAEPRNADGTTTVDLATFLPRVRSHRRDAGISMSTFRHGMTVLVAQGWVTREGAELGERVGARGRRPQTTVRHYRVLGTPGKAAA